ncbi:MAG: hypothetical protein AAF378_23490 [Cyanobacteria bacterium P01_A01_bin.84]
MQAKEIKNKLRLLIKEASTVDSSLAARLDEIDRWVKDIKPGSLTAKKFVILFLQQIVKDAQIYLDIKTLGSQTEQEVYYERMTPTEKYWYSTLFPTWLNQNDPKFYIWRQKLMAEEWDEENIQIIQSISNNIKERGGTFLWRYVADLSMATDIIVSSRQGKSLCIQITSLRKELSQEKSDNWKNSLIAWGIERGLFLNYNPGKYNFVNQIANITLYNSDNLRTGVYLEFSM